MSQRKSARRFRHGVPAGLSMAKSAETEKADATQHSPKHRVQSAVSRWRTRSSSGAAVGKSSIKPLQPTASIWPMSPPFAWTADEIREFGHQVVELIADHLTGLPQRAVFRPVPREVIDGLAHAPVPEAGREPRALLADFAERIEPYPFGNGHPRFFGWINSPPDVVAIFAEALAAAMNPSVAGGNHAAVYVERAVIAWFRSILGFPPESMGLLVSGSSIANLTGLAVARHTAAHAAGIDVRASGLQ